MKRQGGFLMSKIHQVAGRIFNKLLKKYGIEEINSAQGRILFVLWDKDNIPISEISEKTRLEKSTLTSMLDRLEQGGFIKRMPSPEDRRKIIISRTEKDRDFQDRYLAVSGEMTGIYYRGFSDKEIDGFEKKLEKILNNLIDEEK
ncbi:MAG: MarR family transcriptional regulator [Spirochaetales bacterium]|nr:MarR family transcriptional regulator [Spirochaetales bacterium]